MDLNSETLAKAMSRKPVEGHTPGPWMVEDIEEGAEGYRHLSIPEIHRSLHDSEWAEPEDWGRDFTNACLIATAPDLQTENQVLQAAVRQLGDAVAKARNEIETGGWAYNVLRILDDAIALMPTEGET